MTEMTTKHNREQLFAQAEKDLHFKANIYSLGSRFEGLVPELAGIFVLDVTKVPGCHYGLKNVFVPIIHDLETKGVMVDEQPVAVSPESAILVEPSTGNGWVAFSDAAEALGYEHLVIMPGGLPEGRYKHPQNKEITIVKTPAEEYAAGMPKKMKELIKQNSERLAHGEKIYVTPNHPISAAEITIKTMSELGWQLLRKLGYQPLPLRVVVSMGNGASLCALGEYVKEYRPGSQVVATESFNYGGGYDVFARQKDLLSYKELYGIEPGNEALMNTFSAYGTNARIGIKLPLQERAMLGDLIDQYVLFTDVRALEKFVQLPSTTIQHMINVQQLPNYSNLPQSLIDTFGNSTLANIATASQFAERGELVVAMAYDGRGNY